MAEYCEAKNAVEYGFQRTLQGEVAHSEVSHAGSSRGGCGPVCATGTAGLLWARLFYRSRERPVPGHIETTLFGGDGYYACDGKMESDEEMRRVCCSTGPFVSWCKKKEPSASEQTVTNDR